MNIGLPPQLPQDWVFVSKTLKVVRMGQPAAHRKHFWQTQHHPFLSMGQRALFCPMIMALSLVPF